MSSPALRSEEQVRVWRPEGFEGLELIWVQNSPEPYIKQMIMKTYFSVGLEGPAVFEYRGEKQRKSHYTLNVFAAGDVVASRPEKTWSYLAFQTEEVFDQTMISLLGQPDTATLGFKSPFVFDKGLNDFLCGALVSSFQTFIRPTSRLERESYLLTALTKIIKHCAENPPPERRLGKEHRAVRLVKDYLQDNYGSDITSP